MVALGFILQRSASLTTSFKFVRYPGRAALGIIGRFVRTGGGVKRMAKQPTAKAQVAELDEKHCVVMIGGKTRISSWQASPLHPGAKEPCFSTKEDMATFYHGRFVNVSGAEGETKRVALFGYWLARAARAQGVTTVAVNERIVNGQLNLWCGFGVDPKPGDWTLLRQHIADVICDGDAAALDYFLKWSAWTLQIRPSRPRLRWS